MDVEVVITRYCEDLTWLGQFPKGWPITVYDKSGGGPRQRVHLPGWSSADGPDAAQLWSGAIPLANVGTESHTHMHHIVERWDSLATVTLFLSGDGPGHIPDLVERSSRDARIADFGGPEYVPYGDPYTCDRDGRPHAPGLFPELRDACWIFFKGPVPSTLSWHGFSMYLVHRDRIKRFTKDQWAAGRDWCVDKRRALAMERLYDRMFS